MKGCQYCGNKVEQGTEACEYCQKQLDRQPGSPLAEMEAMLDDMGAEYALRPSLFPGEMMPCIAVAFDQGRGHKGCLFEMYYSLSGDYLGHGSWRNQKS